MLTFYCSDCMNQENNITAKPVPVSEVFLSDKSVHIQKSPFQTKVSLFQRCPFQTKVSLFQRWRFQTKVALFQKSPFQPSPYFKGILNA
jgi:hypothetical protein